MLSEERQSKIVELVCKNRSMTVQKLMEELNTSESTIRRDLSELDGKGFLQKVYGGAMAKNMVYDSMDVSVNDRKEINHDSKVKIARYAASLIKDQDFVYLDAGTTTELMIDYISVKNAVFVTNAFFHAKKLSERGYTTYILGGQIKLMTETIVGEEALLGLRKYHFTKGFWGTNAISRTSGYSTPDVSEALVKQISMEHSDVRYILADNSKFNQASCVTFADFEDCTVITYNLNSESQSYADCSNVTDIGAIVREENR